VPGEKGGDSLDRDGESMNYPRIAQTAARLINANGQNVTLSRRSGGDRDSVTGEMITPEVVETFLMRGVLTNFDTKLIDGTLITNRDRKLLISGGIRPETGDRAIIGTELAGEVIAVINEVNPGGLPLVYELQVRI